MVTLVIEEAATGKRVRNLVSSTSFPAGDNVIWWDGLDDLGRDPSAARNGVYHIPSQFVATGRYRVRGIYYDPIHARYEFSVYTGGHPAWETPDHTGGWLSDHTPPSAVLFVPDARIASDQPARPSILVGCSVSESQDGLVWLSEDGRKLHGQKWLSGTWTAAAQLTRDVGPHPAPGIYAYAAAVWKDRRANSSPELRLNALLTETGRRPSSRQLGTGMDRPVLSPPYRIDPPPSSVAVDDSKSLLTGLAAYNGVVVVSQGPLNQLLFVDAAESKVLGKVSIPDPRGVTFDAQGRLLVVSDRTVLRFPAVSKPVPSDIRLPQAQRLITSHLDEPQEIALDGSGNLYLSDRGQSHQVKVFSSAGTYLRSIGKPGAPAAGPYDPLQMQNPRGITFDSKGNLWVAEEDFQPKRISVWSTTTGKLLNAFYGPGTYGGGGTLDPQDKTRFYYSGMEFTLNWEQGTSLPSCILWRPTTATPPLPLRAGPPETPISFQERRYFTNTYTSSPAIAPNSALLWRRSSNGVAILAAAVGQASDWNLLKTPPFRSRWPDGLNPDDPRRQNAANQGAFFWSDRNADGIPQPSEVAIQQATIKGVAVMPDLSFAAADFSGRAVQWSPTGFTPEGVPLYSPDGKGASFQTLAEGVQSPPSTGGGQALIGQGGWTLLTTAPRPFSPYGLGGVKDGSPLWSYPSLWPGLHASHFAPLPGRPGMLIGTTRLLGPWVTPRTGEAGPLFGINGNQGNLYLFTQDGLFVTQLFQDVRNGSSWNSPSLKRGSFVDSLTLNGEAFRPSLTQTTDGSIYLVVGQAHQSLVRIEGLESIRRLPEVSLNVTEKDLQAARTYLQQLTPPDSGNYLPKGSPLPVVLQDSSPIVDGRLDEWNAAQWASIDQSGVVSYSGSGTPSVIAGALAVSGDRLYAAYRTGVPDLLKNSAESRTTLFKTGGALDLMIGTQRGIRAKTSRPQQGDQRLLVTQAPNAKLVAVLYRSVVPGTKTPVPFSSPSNTITFDGVDDVSDQVQLASDGKGNYEFSVPLSLLNLKPAVDEIIRGDIGVLRGDGYQTIRRLYWNNKRTAIVSDIPSEAALVPSQWGLWRFVTPGTVIPAPAETKKR